MTARILDFPASETKVVIHSVAIGRAPIGWKAVCTCGWSVAGIDKTRIECMASVHDLSDDAA